MTASADFWNDNLAAQKVVKRLSNLKEELMRFTELFDEVTYVQEIIKIAEEEGEVELYNETIQELVKLKKQFQKYEFLILFSGTHDIDDAIVSLHAGAGGTEAQDWVEILCRMYSRWAEDNNYEVEILDYLAGDEAGIKSVTLLIKGSYAYGKLKCEEGVHRLIRISPYDSSGRRHTSFASISVLPDIEDNVAIAIKQEDLRIDTYRSGGAGGQHVNKTDSAVRITHLPSGIVVQCQNERSQHSNRLAAMKILTAKLHELREKELEDNLQSLKGEYKEIAWGHQIRTYTLNPFNLVKDHRTSVETGNVQAVLDGEINDFIHAYLQQQVQND